MRNDELNNDKIRNPVAKGMNSMRSSGGQGVHKDKKRAAKDSDRKQKHKGRMLESQSLPMASSEHDDTSMARSELYRNAKYAMAMMRMIKIHDDVPAWLAANLTRAAEYLDKVYHHLDYREHENTLLPESKSVFDEFHDPLDDELGETSGSIARENLLMISEYSIKMFNLLPQGRKLEGWVAMKLTKASEAVSSAKHWLEYATFEKHGMDAFADVEPEITESLVESNQNVDLDDTLVREVKPGISLAWNNVGPDLLEALGEDATNSDIIECLLDTGLESIQDHDKVYEKCQMYLRQAYKKFGFQETVNFLASKIKLW